jgi:hypothetical protein
VKPILVIATIATAVLVNTACNAQSPQIIDTHVHVDGHMRGGADWGGAARRALEKMDGAGVRLSFVVPPPQPPGFPVTWECDEYARVFQGFPQRFALVCGGGSLSRLIVEHARQPAVDPAIARRMEELAGRFAALGAVSLGEFAAQHFSFEARHPYIGFSPDHALMQLLADLGARHRLPIELHMEIIRGTFDMPQGLRQASSQNPAQIADNLAAFERLLAHNREAVIVWSHYGWDNTGQRTGALMKDLLARHPNLYSNVKIQPGSPPSRHIFTETGDLKPDFVDAIEAFPDRFMVGSDAFYSLQPTPAAREADRLIGSTQKLAASLKPETARQVLSENAIRLYRLKERGLVP